MAVFVLLNTPLRNAPESLAARQRVALVQITNARLYRAYLLKE